jgi:hypothetical protein
MRQVKSTPPKALISTWITLMRGNETVLNGMHDREASAIREKAKDKLLNTFGSIDGLIKYMRENGLN